MEVGKNKVILSHGMSEIIEKKSRFIAICRSVNSEEEAEDEIKKAKKKYYDARHVCFAYIIEGNPNILRCSDDGEPSGTAGKPMLDILEGEGLVNALFICVRYFGGTLLGTGGLVRAYQGAAKAAFLNSKIGIKIKGIAVEIISTYEDHGKIQYIVEQNGFEVKETIYMERITMVLHIPEEAYETLKNELIERTSGRAKIVEKGSVFLINKI